MTLCILWENHTGFLASCESWRQGQYEHDIMMTTTPSDETTIAQFWGTEGTFILINRARIIGYYLVSTYEVRHKNQARGPKNACAIISSNWIATSGKTESQNLETE